MKRNLDIIKRTHFDIVVVGAGVYGACVARDAAMRGLSVALIDKGDICGQTSHNSLKIIHGGLRYLQHLNVKRTLESIHEQKAWLTIAPHLVRPLPCIMPTYGHGLRGPEIMWCGFKVYELLGIMRNLKIPEGRKIPRGKILSQTECVDRIPGAKTHNLTGAALWYDAQVFGANEAVIEIAESAFQCGAQIANYVKVRSFIQDANKVKGVRVQDEISQELFEIKSRLVINTTGPWVTSLLSSLDIDHNATLNLPLTKSMNIVTRKIFGEYAVGIESKRQSDSVVGATKRLYFFTPWKDCTIIGTTHFPYDGNPDTLTTTTSEVKKFIDEINQVYPAANLSLNDIRYCYTGLTPAEDAQASTNGKAEAGRSHHSRIIDHGEVGCDGILSVIGVKYTTARGVAEKVLNLACKKLGTGRLSCKTHKIPLGKADKELPDLTTLSLDELREFCEDQIENTMAIHLTDLVFRRLDLAMRGRLTPDKLELCVDILTTHFDWSEERKRQELNELKSFWLGPQLREVLASY